MKWLWLPIMLAVLAGCEREDREVRGDPIATETTERISLTSLSPGATPPKEQRSGLGAQYLGNAYHVSEGKRWYVAFNCNGCHFNGGGGSGPALMDDRWIYGSKIENVVETIREGRPNGMPSFRGKVTDEQIWQLAAYVLSLSGQVASDVAPGRNDDLMPHPAENATSPETPVNGGTPK
jgi:cytochrome c oxidase cbb3-type subunit 3